MSLVDINKKIRHAKLRREMGASRWLESDRPYNCKTCEEDLFYSDEFDAFFCKKCDVFKEKNCGDKDCYFCINRPEKPSEVKH